MHQESASADTIWNWFIERPMRYGLTCLALIVLATLDIILTAIVLNDGGAEANPIANTVINNHGMWGMVLFKFALVTCFILLCEEVGRRQPHVGKRLAQVGIGISSIPIIWTLGLFVFVF